MPFDVERNDLITEYKIEPSRMQILTESEMLLPQTQSDVKRIVKDSAQAAVTDSNVTDGRVNFKGKVKLNIIYVSSDGNLCSYKNTLAFEDFMNCDDIRKDSGADIDAKIESVDVWRINERKIGAKVVSSVYAYPYKTARANIVSDVKDKEVEALSTNEEIRNHKGYFTSSFDTHESLSLPAGKPDAGEILEELCYITDADAKPMRNGYRVTAVVKADITYSTDDDESVAQSVHYEIPFDMTAEGEGIDENSRLKCRAYIDDTRSGIFQDGDGKSRIIDLDMKIGTVVEASKDERVSFIEDAYSVNQACTAQKTDIILPKFIGSNKARVQIKGQPVKASDKDAIMQVVSAEGQIIDENSYVSQNTVQTEGMAEVKIMYIAENDSMPVDVLITAVPFHQEIEVLGAKEGDSADVHTEIDSLYINLPGGKEAEPIINLVVDADVYRISNRTAVEDITASDESQQKTASAVIYVVQDGDTMWNIAKKYRTTIGDIETVNDMEKGKEVKAGDKLLIMRKVV
jgi:LysM repeat protein